MLRASRALDAPNHAPYSPDFNPIEMAISKLKSALRKLAERTVAGLIAILEGCVSLFNPVECKHYFRAASQIPPVSKCELPLWAAGYFTSEGNDRYGGDSGASGGDPVVSVLVKG